MTTHPISAWFVGAVVALATALGGAGVRAADAPPGTPPANIAAQALADQEAAFRKRLNEVIVPAVDFDLTPVHDVLEHIRTKLIAPDPLLNSVQIIHYRLDNNGTVEIPARAIALHLRQARLGDVLKRFCQEADLQFVMLGTKWFFADRTVELDTLAWEAAAMEKGENLYRRLNSITLTLPTLETDEASLTELYRLLSTRGQELDPEKRPLNFVILCRAPAREPSSLGDRHITMKLNNVPMGVAIRYACMATATQTRIERYAVVIKDRMCGCGSGSDESALTAALPRPVSANARRFQDRLNRMFVNVDFEKVRLQDAAVFLQRRSQELDPAKKGINLVLVKGERAAAQEGANPAPGITLRLSQVPLEEALHYACMLAGGRYRIEDDSVVVTLP